MAAGPGNRAPALIHDPVERDRGRQRVVDRNHSHSGGGQARRHETGVVFGQQAPISAVQVDKDGPWRRTARGEDVERLVRVIAIRDIGFAWQARAGESAAFGILTYERSDVRYRCAGVISGVQRRPAQSPIERWCVCCAGWERRPV